MGANDPRVQVPSASELTLGAVCVDRSEPGHTRWRMRADERFANPAGTIQGGLLGALADTAMGASVITWCQGRKMFASNAEMKVSFFRPATVGSTLTCEATVVSGGERVVFTEAEVIDDRQRRILRASSTYLLTPR